MAQTTRPASFGPVFVSSSLLLLLWGSMWLLWLLWLLLLLLLLLWSRGRGCCEVGVVGWRRGLEVVTGQQSHVTLAGTSNEGGDVVMVGTVDVWWCCWCLKGVTCTVYEELIFIINQCHCGLVVCGAYLLQPLGCRFDSCWLHFQKINLNF
jgi:hypothetical protein